MSSLKPNNSSGSVILAMKWVGIKKDIFYAFKDFYFAKQKHKKYEYIINFKLIKKKKLIIYKFNKTKWWTKSRT